MVVAQAVVEEGGIGVLEFGAEAEGTGGGALLGDDVAEGVVFAEAGRGGSGGLGPGGDIAVAVEGRMEDGRAGGGGQSADGKKTADAAGALEGAGEIEAPEIGLGQHGRG